MSVHKAKHPTRGRANLALLRRTKDSDIVRTAPPELDNLPHNFWDGAMLVVPVTKRAISLRVDEDVLDWFKTLGSRYQSRMNAVLRSYKAHMQMEKGTLLRQRGMAQQGAPPDRK